MKKNSFFTLEEILNDIEKNEVKEHCEERRHISDLLKKLEIYEIFCTLFKRGNNFYINEKGRDFTISILDFYKSKAGKALRKNNFNTLSIYQNELQKLLFSFDDSISDCIQNNNKLLFVKTWFHNTTYYNYFIIKPEIEKKIENLNHASEIRNLFNNTYFLSPTQKLSLMEDIAQNEEQFIITGNDFIKSLEQVAYAELKNQANFNYNENIENAIMLLQIIDYKTYKTNLQYQKWEKEIQELESKNEINLSLNNEIKKRKTKMTNIKDQYLKNELSRYCKNLDSNTTTYAVNLYNKYIRKGKIEYFTDITETGFIAHYGTTDYSVLKTKCLYNNC